MSGSTYGKQFTITTWGESHGPGVGCVVDGCPAGINIKENDIQEFLDRRKPGQSSYVTPRKESDDVEILSGVFQGKTTGTPISLLVKNANQRSKDYEHLKDIYRPGHGDYTFDKKYGFRDYHGGGRTSGRETIGRVAGGAIAIKLLKELNISLTAFTKSIGIIDIPQDEYDFSQIDKNPFYMPHLSAPLKTQEYLDEIMNAKDSVGGQIECLVRGLPVGLGEPVFDKLDANLAKGLFSIGSVKGVEIGDGFDVSKNRGSINNDSFFSTEKNVQKKTNHSGGVLGGLSDGDELIVRVAIKPTPSIGMNQKTVTRNFEETDIAIQGRHDPIIVPRAVVVVESMVALALADLLLQNMGSQIDYLKKIYIDKWT